MAQQQQQQTTKTRSTPVVMAHYMPWYEADPARDFWGWHWTMNHFRPQQEKGGRREAASHYYPRIGLYDSNDPDLLECHVLLMKAAGVGGVLVDWYGVDDLLDYGLLHRNTGHLLRWAKKAGLKFAVVYEDQTVPKLREAKRLPADDVLAHGRRVVGWLQRNWFRDPAYLRWDDRPVLLVFGSGFYTGEQWRDILGGLDSPAPHLVTQRERRGPAVGAFAWPEPGKGTDGALKDVADFYARAKGWPRVVSGAFPRFHDVYEAAKLHKSYGRIEDRGGKVYRETLERAFTVGADVAQLITWNDWGEGTMIEPSVEFGYRDLEATQEMVRRHVAPRLAYGPEDLRAPVALYRLRKEHGKDPAHAKALAELSGHLFAGRSAEARRLLRSRYPAALADA